MAERGQWTAQWIPIAAKFPASLAKDASPETLKDGESPDAYGLGIDQEGYLYTDSSPSAGTTWDGIATVSNPTDSPLTGAQVWRFAHNRLWGHQVTTNNLTYGAYGYDSDYLLSGLGYIPCDYESSLTTQVVPFGSNIALFKSDHLYIIRNADNPNNGFVAEYVRQSSGLPVAGNVIAIDNILCWVNTYGVFSYDGQQLTELTMPIRNNLGAFASGQIDALRADFEQRRIIGRSGSDTKFIMDLSKEGGIYDYSTSGFRFTSRTLVGAEGEPLLIDKVGFVYQYSAGDMATVNMDVKLNDTWKTEQQFKIVPANDNGRAEFSLENNLACRKFALRLTAMSASLFISKIMIHVKSGGILGYSNK